MNNVQSPRSDDDAIEQEIINKGLTAPRVTPADIEANIAGYICFNVAKAAEALSIPSSPSMALLTICVLTTNSGFTVTGESACASPENFDAELGAKIAIANAKEKLWPLMGYALKEKLTAGQ